MSEDWEQPPVTVNEFEAGKFSVEQISESVKFIEETFFKGKCVEIRMPGIKIEQRVLRHLKPLHMLVQHDFSFFKMQFELTGHSSYMPANNHSIPVLVPGGHHQFFYLPQVHGRLSYPAIERKTLEVVLTELFIRKMFEDDFSGLGHMGNAILKHQPALLHHEAMPILPAAKKLVYDIIQCAYSGNLKRIFLEAKVAELLLLQVAQANQIKPVQKESILRGNDREKIYAARELIHKTIQTPCSILQLAEKSGLNDFKLKKGFKEIFGTTVFGYMTQVRMEEAKTMLLNGKLSVSEIAFEVGYKNPQHFTTAFKRCTGYLPSEIKSNAVEK